MNTAGASEGMFITANDLPGSLQTKWNSFDPESNQIFRTSLGKFFAVRKTGSTCLECNHKNGTSPSQMNSHTERTCRPHKPEPHAQDAMVSSSGALTRAECIPADPLLINRLETCSFTEPLVEKVTGEFRTKIRKAITVDPLTLRNAIYDQWQTSWLDYNNEYGLPFLTQAEKGGIIYRSINQEWSLNPRHLKTVLTILGQYTTTKDVAMEVACRLAVLSAESRQEREEHTGHHPYRRGPAESQNSPSSTQSHQHRRQSYHPAYRPDVSHSTAGAEAYPSDSGINTHEYKALLAGKAKCEIAFRSLPEGLIDDLFSKNHISTEVHDDLLDPRSMKTAQDNARELFECIRNAVEQNSSVFHLTLKSLRSERGFRTIANILQTHFDKARQ